MSTLSNDLDDLITKEGYITSNKVANFAYTDKAYANNTADGVETYSEDNEQNIPVASANALKVNTGILYRGFRTQTASLTRMLVNHFFGRLSYNTNKVNDNFATLLSLLKSYLGKADGFASLKTDGTIPWNQMDTRVIMYSSQEWDANTNTPDILSNTYINTWLFYVSVAGSQKLNGSSTATYFNVGDKICYSHTTGKWTKFEKGSVATVNGKSPDATGNIANIATIDSSGKLLYSELPYATVTATMTEWDASTDTPRLLGTTPSNHSVYLVGTAGTQTIDDVDVHFEVGDFMYHFGNGKWIKITQGTVKSVDSVKPNETGDVYLGAVRKIDGNKPNTNGEISLDYLSNNRAIARYLVGSTFKYNELDSKFFVRIIYYNDEFVGFVKEKNGDDVDDVELHIYESSNGIYWYDSGYGFNINSNVTTVDSYAINTERNILYICTDACVYRFVGDLNPEKILTADYRTMLYVGGDVLLLGSYDGSEIKRVVDNGTTYTVESTYYTGSSERPHSISQFAMNTYSGVIVAVSTDISWYNSRGIFYSTSAGATWEDATGYTANSTTKANGAFSNVVYANGIFVATALFANTDNIELVYSYNGKKWRSSKSFTSNIDFTGLVYGNGMFVATGNWGNLFSPDGVSWSQSDYIAQTSMPYYYNGHFYTRSASTYRFMRSDNGKDWNPIDIRLEGYSEEGTSEEAYLMNFFGKNGILIGNCMIGGLVYSNADVLIEKGVIS